MAAPREVVELVERFDQHIDAYRSGKYNETQLRRDFIDPFFRALGWDVDNKQNFAEQYREVVHEDAIKIGGFTKAPDYSFRIGGTRKFFIEAKNPSVDIKEKQEPAFQLRRYAWSAKLPLSILTDFEEFAVYDCRIRPKKTDKASTARLTYWTYKDYVEKWDEITAIFSKDAILRGAFDQYATTTKGKRGTAEVDDAFLDEIEKWRESIAKNIALRNEDLDEAALNYAVQLTIDRIIFLRICEDRGVEQYGQLLALCNGNNVYQRLVEIYQKADQRYNSGLFHFRREPDRAAPDLFTPGLTIDDKALKDIFKILYYPDSPYEFSVISADILGSVYERFLGKVIQLTPGHRAKIKEKPEVKKAGGVYYTPTYIVDYIVKNTVGKLVENKTPKQTEKLRILDPACGSGSFLIGALQFLFDWHLDWYTQNNPEKYARGKSPAIYQRQKGEWKLTITEKKRILTNNIYGVDIDMQAVEVTKLSLLLKVMEGESQPDLFAERVLPDLGNNIKCGNSLIGTDIYQQQTGLFDSDTDQLRKLNPFDWDREFPEIMKNGGFDAVIGNPPYVRQELLSDIKSYLQEHFQTYHGIADLYVYFIERGVKLLNKNGYYGNIVANKWMRANYGKPLRLWLKQQCLQEIIDFGDLPIFQKATTYPCILIIKASVPQDEFMVANVTELHLVNFEQQVKSKLFPASKNIFGDEAVTLINSDIQNLLNKIKAGGTPLGEYVNGKIYRGILTGLNEAFVISESTRKELINNDPSCENLIKPFVVGKDVKRYQTLNSDRYLILIPKGWTKANINHKKLWNGFKKKHPSIATHLEPYREKAEKRYDKGEYWWELRSCDYYDEFEKSKIIVPAIVKNASYCLDTNGNYSNDKTSIISCDDLYILAILNSKLSDMFLHLIASTKRGGYFEYKPMYIEQIPIYKFWNNEKSNVKTEISHLATQRIQLTRKQNQAKVASDIKLLDRQIHKIEEQINRIVYSLYNLSEDEIRIIEETIHH